MTNFFPKVNLKVMRERLKKLFPFYRWANQYTLTDLTYDLIAGLSVGMTIVPQSLAHATIAGLPVQYGLYSSFMGPFIYAIFGTSKDVTLGPTAVISLLVYSYTHNLSVLKFAPYITSNIMTESSINHNMNHSSTFVTQQSQNVMLDNTVGIDNMLKIHYAVLLTFMSGLLQIVLGFMQLGFLISFISHPVICGFINAAALIIGFGQIKVAKSTFLKETYQTFKGIRSANPWDTALGLTSLFLLLYMKKQNRSTWITTYLFQPSASISPISNLSSQKFDENLEKIDPRKMVIEENASVMAENVIFSLKQNCENNTIQLNKISSHRTNYIKKFIGLSVWMAKTALQKIVWLLLIGRNAVIITLSAIIAYFLVRSQLFEKKNYHITLTPSISNHIPSFRVPQFAFTYIGSNKNLMRMHSFGQNVSEALLASNDIHIPATVIFKDIGFGFVTITFIGILESLAIAKAFARKNKYTINSTQEFVALGISNFMSSFVSSYPVTASFSRTAINSQTGVRTPAGGLVLELDFVCAMVTLMACIFFGVEIGIFSGVVISLAFLLTPIFRPQLSISFENLCDQYKNKAETHTISDVSDTFTVRQLIQVPKNQLTSRYCVIKPTQSLFYPSSEYFFERVMNECLNKYTSDQNLHCSDMPYAATSTSIQAAKLCEQNNHSLHSTILNFNKTNMGPIKKSSLTPANIIIDCSHIQDMDYTIIQELEDLTAEIRALKQELILCNINETLQRKVSQHLSSVKFISTLVQAKAYLSSYSNYPNRDCLDGLD